MLYERSDKAMGGVSSTSRDCLNPQLTLSLLSSTKAGIAYINILNIMLRKTVSDSARFFNAVVSIVVSGQRSVAPLCTRRSYGSLHRDEAAFPVVRDSLVPIVVEQTVCSAVHLCPDRCLTM